MPDASPPALPSWKVPTRLGDAWFRCRALAHVLRRALADRVTSPVARHPAAETLQAMPVIAEHRSRLWTDGRPDEFPLVAGKVENLRVARHAFDGIEIPANAVFSFWQQLGRPTRARGFVEGREIRAGCVVPVVAGGLCQLSNAIVRCAVDAGLVLVERHGHSARIERASDDAGLDATVFWNYVDLRLAAPFAWRLEVTLTADELVVRVRAALVRTPAPASRTIAIAGTRAPLPAARGCLTCDETRCFRHPGAARATVAGTTAVLVDAWTPEFARHLVTRASHADWFLPWLRSARRIVGAWTPSPSGTHTIAHLASWRRTWWLRRAAGDGGGRQAAVMRGQHALAQAFARRLRPHHTHLVIDQGLLLPLARLGALQGRTYEVLMPALPIAEIQRRLDDAASRTPAAASLRDFRVSQADADLEAAALRGAAAFATPHRDVARHLRANFTGRVDELAWTQAPAVQRRATTSATPPLVAFPASALARKGAPELAAALRHLGWRVLVLGTPSDDATLWHGIDVDHARLRDDAWLQRADVVALPAWIEHAPRALLRALANGLPVVATRACGLPAAPNLHEIDAGDVVGLVEALKRALATEETLTPA